MAKNKWDVRKIPKSDKAKRSLYMSPTYMKNLKGKAANIKWVGEKKDGAQSLKSEYEYQQSSGKNPQVRGRRKQVYKDPISTQSVDVKKRHQSERTKEGGYDTTRYTKVEDKYKHQLGEGGYAKDKTGEGMVRKIQNKKGKVIKKEYLLNKLKAKEKEKAKKKKTVKQKITTYEGKKGDTIKPKVKEKKGWRLPTAKEKEESKKTIDFWSKSKKGSGSISERKQAKRETDSTVQKQIKSGFGDMLSPSNFEKKKKEQESSFAKKKKQQESSFAEKKRGQESSFEKKKREMEASFAKKKKSMGG